MEEVDRQKRMYFSPLSKCEGLRHKLRKEIIEKYISEILTARDQFLDVGCAEGYYVRFSARRNQESIGLDIDKDSIKRASKLSKINGLQKAHYVIGDAGNLPFKDYVFKVVLCSQTLEHLPDYERCINEIRRVTVKNGWSILSVPSEVSSLLSLVWRIFVKLGLIRPHTYGHLRSFDVDNLLTLLNSEGFMVEDVKGIHVYYVSSLSMHYREYLNFLSRLVDEIFYRINLILNKVLSLSQFEKKGVVTIILARCLWRKYA